MDRILNRICTITNHPISKLDEQYTLIYIKGLGTCLYILSNDSPITFMYFKAWANCVALGFYNVDSLWHEDLRAIKVAMSIQRKGFRFFSMKYPLLFDIFYILQASQTNGYNKSLSDSIFLFLRERVCGLFTRPALKDVYNFFNVGKATPQIPSQLVEHMKMNNEICSKPEKRILVVANVSAGKSTLINALVGYRFNRTKTTACTDKLVFIHNKCSNDGITSKNNKGEYWYDSNVNDVNSDSLIEAAFHFKSTLGKENICFIDTPGINNADDFTHKQITEKIIKKGDYDAVLYVSNCQYFGTNDEHNLLKFLKANVKKTIIFVLNQLDVFNPEEDSISKMLSNYKSDLTKFGFRNPVVIPVSAYVSFLVRLESSCLTKTENIKKMNMLELFKDEYYDLPRYIGQGGTSDILDMAGIKILENKITTV